MAEIPQETSSELEPREHDFTFAMRQNGFTIGQIDDTGRTGYIFHGETLSQKTKELSGLGVSLFGPSSGVPPFFNTENPEIVTMGSAFVQKPVLDTIGKFRRYDEEQAGRIAFVLGGLVRQMEDENVDPAEVNRAVRFAADLIRLGDPKSGDAIAAAAAMYVLSGGPIDKNSEFEGYVYHMSDAIAEDPIVPRVTADLGLSQTLRLRSFIDKLGGRETRPYPDIAKDLRYLEDFPTVGAEFHFSPDVAEQFPYLWQRLALLNISQSQLGNYVQLSRDDRGVIEVRMNPSNYAVAIADWNHLRYIFPELNQAYFTATFNRDNQDFAWKRSMDGKLLRTLRGLGLVSYATVFDNIPEQERREEVNFGSVYLGQTVKMDQGKFKFSGQWGGRGGNFGQLGIYAGFGDSLPYLTYYPSMALAKPEILSPVKRDLIKVKTLHDAFSFSPEERKEIFEELDEEIASDPRLKNASEAGVRIVQKLTP